MAVMLKGGEHDGWRAVQMDPDVPNLRWFCMKPVCQHAYSAALAEAQETWVAKYPPPEPEPMPEPEPVIEPTPLPEPEPPPREPPPELLAFETSDVEEAGFKDEPFPYSRFDVSEPEEPQEPPAAEGRYVPKPSAQSGAKFIRHRGTGEPGDG